MVWVNSCPTLTCSLVSTRVLAGAFLRQLCSSTMSYDLSVLSLAHAGRRFPLLYITWFQHCPSSLSRKTWTHTHSFFAHRLGTLYLQGSVLPEGRKKTGFTTTLVLLTVGDGGRQFSVDEMVVRRLIKYRVLEAMAVPVCGTYPSHHIRLHTEDTAHSWAHAQRGNRSPDRRCEAVLPPPKPARSIKRHRK